MNEILRTLAAMHLLNFCKEHGISSNGNGEGSYVKKDGRGFKFSLLGYTSGKVIATIQFHKRQVPTFTVNREFITSL